MESIDLQIEDRRVEIRLSHLGSGVFCLECGGACGLANHADEQRWRHLDTMQFTTELVARLPRSRCAEHGVKTIVPPWAGKHSRFTRLFEAFAVEVLQALQDRESGGCQAAADMLPAYANAVARQTPNAELVHDTFHVAKYLTEAVDRVRRAENKDLQAQDDDRLKGTRQLWLFNKSNLSPQQRCRFAAIKRKGLKTARAWAIKEQFRWFWRHVVPMSAKDFFKQWYRWGVRCRLQPIVKVARMLKRHLPGLLSTFDSSVTNAASEGFNSVIQALKYAARGFKSFKNYRTRILFFCGRLDLRPQLPCH